MGYWPLMRRWLVCLMVSQMAVVEVLPLCAAWEGSLDQMLVLCAGTWLQVPIEGWHLPMGETGTEASGIAPRGVPSGLGLPMSPPWDILGSLGGSWMRACLSPLGVVLVITTAARSSVRGRVMACSGVVDS